MTKQIRRIINIMVNLVNNNKDHYDFIKLSSRKFWEVFKCWQPKAIIIIIFLWAALKHNLIELSRQEIRNLVYFVDFVKFKNLRQIIKLIKLSVCLFILECAILELLAFLLNSNIKSALITFRVSCVKYKLFYE